MNQRPLSPLIWINILRIGTDGPYDKLQRLPTVGEMRIAAQHGSEKAQQLINEYDLAVIKHRLFDDAKKMP